MGFLRVFPSAFLYCRVLSIINYGARCRTVVRYGKLWELGAGSCQGKGAPGPTSGLLVLPAWYVWCRAQLPLARRSGSAHHCDRGFGHVLNPLQGESNWSYINSLIQGPWIDPAPTCFTEASSTSQQEMRSGVKAMSNPGCPTSPPSPHPAALSIKKRKTLHLDIQLLKLLSYLS